jgi:RNA polymerase sigma-70 factor (ECF subfamily)
MLGAEEEAALLARMARGDDRALGRVVEALGPRLHALALRFTGDGAEAEAIVNGAFLALWRQAARWRTGEARVGTWLHRVVVNRCIDHARRQRRRRWLGLGGDGAEAADALASEGPGAERALAARDELAAMRAEIRRLPERQRAAILLAAGGDRGAGEIAAILGVSEGAAEQLLVRARRRLRERRRALPGEGPAAPAGRDGRRQGERTR